MIASANITAVLEMDKWGPDAHWDGGELTLKLTFVPPDPILLRAWHSASIRKMVFLNPNGNELYTMFVTNANPGGCWHVDQNGSVLMTKDGKPFVPGSEVVTHKQ